MKKLPDSLYEEAKNVPAGQVGIPFLTPTDKDNFIEKKQGKDSFKISLDGNYMVVKIKNHNKEIDMQILDSKLESDYYLAKIYGYIMFKILTRYV